MNKIIIDTNCLLSFVTDRNAEQQERIVKLFQQAGHLEVLLLCHHHVLSEFVFVLSSVYSTEPDTIHTIITDLVAMPGVMPVSEVNIKTVLSLWPAVIPDYGDAVIAAYCKDTKGTAVATFDKKFRKAMKKAGIIMYQL
ncbi:MAG: type II toxin-antitoxin system VapC family toxin [Candidatus Electrothrix sp. MAN1_4]|nr:type II toxin-antitoxin system VapC family toxin [Candidatus Electrothrix sp. MAN1_4]